MANIKRRAVSQEQKEKRRQDILDSARELFNKTTHYDSLLMKHIAENISLTKGTLYLYFKTKEEVFLALYTEEFTRLFNALDALLDRDSGQGSIDTFIDILSANIVSQQTFLRLNSMLHSVLEQNIEYDTALAFKTMLRDRVLQTGLKVETYLGGLNSGQGAEILLSAHELMIGCYHAATPTPSLEEIFERPDMSFMKLEFETEFPKLLGLVLRSLCQK